VEHLDGTFVSLVESLAKSLNFKPIYKRAMDKNWTKIIEDIGSGVYDSAAIDFSINEIRQHLVDFSSPIDINTYQ